MKDKPSLHENLAHWDKAAMGLWDAKVALYSLGCEHQANCIGGILEAALAARSAVNEQIERETELLFRFPEVNPCLNTREVVW